MIKNQQAEKMEVKAAITSTQTPTPTASPSATPSPTVSAKKKSLPTSTPTQTPTPTPSRVSVLLVNDGTTAYCLSEWADEVKRASQVVKDVEEVINKLSDCLNSCRGAFENAWNDCRSKYPNNSDGTSTPENMACYNKVNTERTSCLSGCPSSSGDNTEILGKLYLNREKSKKFLQETKGEHCK